MPQCSLADLSLDSVTERLQALGSSLEGDNHRAILALLQALESGLKGTLAHEYHLSAIDPGVGKTLSVAAFLRSWKEQGFNPSSSVLIGLSRLEEIDSYLSNSGLTKEDVAVLTSDKERNALGLPPAQHDTARVMFTTQQMIERRTRGRSFADAKEFHFQGGPRTLRIWDESFAPAEGLSLRADDLVRLLAPLRRACPEYAEATQKLATELWAANDGDQVTIPRALHELPSLAGAVKNSTQLSEITETLGRLAGRDVTAVNTGHGDIHLAGSSPPIPSDFAPVIIMDASGRVRSTYDAWEKSGAPLHRLPDAVKDYRNLTIHLWERSIGKEAFKNSATREEVAEAVAEAIRDDMNSPWLIISYKDQPIAEQLRKALKGNEPEGGLHFLTWGMHHGTNAYAHCKNVVLIGQMTYGPVGYSALASALGADTEGAEQFLKDGEYRHHWLQALTRASVRLSRGSLAGACRAYVIATPGIRARGLLAETFPGCQISDWSPKLLEVAGQAAALIALLEQLRAEGNLPISKKELREALGIPKAPNLSRLWHVPAVQACLERNRMEEEGRNVLLRAPGFTPLEGDNLFTIDDLENITER